MAKGYSKEEADKFARRRMGLKQATRGLSEGLHKLGQAYEKGRGPTNNYLSGSAEWFGGGVEQQMGGHPATHHGHGKRKKQRGSTQEGGNLFSSNLW